MKLSLSFTRTCVVLLQIRLIDRLQTLCEKKKKTKTKEDLVVFGDQPCLKDRVEKGAADARKDVAQQDDVPVVDEAHRTRRSIQHATHHRQLFPATVSSSTPPIGQSGRVVSVVQDGNPRVESGRRTICLPGSR